MTWKPPSRSISRTVRNPFELNLAASARKRADRPAMMVVTLALQYAAQSYYPAPMSISSRIGACGTSSAEPSGEAQRARLELHYAIIEALNDWAEDDAVACVLVIGNEDYFCSGWRLDVLNSIAGDERRRFTDLALKFMKTMPCAAVFAPARRLAARPQAPAHRWRTRHTPPARRRRKRSLCRLGRDHVGWAPA